MRNNLLNFFIVFFFLLLIFPFVFSADANNSFNNFSDLSYENKIIHEDYISLFGKSIEKKVLGLYLYFSFLFIYFVFVLYIAFKQEKISHGPSIKAIVKSKISRAIQHNRFRRL
jgi:hypothetical protein